jgi:hypothetical protein
MTMLGVPNALRSVNAGMAGEQIADHAGDHGINPNLCTDHLHGLFMLEDALNRQKKKKCERQLAYHYLRTAPQFPGLLLIA